MCNKYMACAIEQAKKAQAVGEVPVGAAIFRNGELIAAAHNETLMQKNPCAHAEVIAINRAFKKLGSHRLDDCELFVTLEPCAMCAGAVMLARLKRVYFGAYDAEKGACGGKIDISHDMNCKTEIYGGICEGECVQILKEFFKNLNR